MRPESKAWLNQAKEDFKAAMYNFKGKQYRVTTFLCQQAVEKALKAVCISKTGSVRKIHDLVLLGKEVQLPTYLLDPLKELTMAYIYSRYPDVKQEIDLSKKAFNFLSIVKEVLEWAEKNL